MDSILTGNIWRQVAGETKAAKRLSLSSISKHSVRELTPREVLLFESLWK